MSSRYYSQFKERKIGTYGSPPSPGKSAGRVPEIREDSPDWPGLPGKGGPNRDKLKTKKVKTRVSEHL